MTPKEFFKLAEEHGADMVDLKFTDFLGAWQHCSYPIDTWDKGTFEDGVGFDGSSIRGWQGIHESDMLAVPDASTAPCSSASLKNSLAVMSVRVCD